MSSPLRAYRKENAVTLAKLSEATGINEAHLSKLERGKAGVSLPNAIKLAATTGLPVEAFVRQ